VKGEKILARLASGFLFWLANPEFYTHLASWQVVIRTPEDTLGTGQNCPYSRGALTTQNQKTHTHNHTQNRSFTVVSFFFFLIVCVYFIFKKVTIVLACQLRQWWASEHYQHADSWCVWDGPAGALGWSPIRWFLCESCINVRKNFKNKKKFVMIIIIIIIMIIIKCFCTALKINE
jgi:hypothetical protein